MQLPDTKPFLRKVRKVATKKRLAIAGGIVLAFLVATPIITYASYARDIGDQERLMNRNNTGIILRDRNGEIFYKYGKINGSDDVKLSQVSDDFETAIVASEDRDFWNHDGYSIRGIAAAAYANILNKDASRYGGSTITQQLVKNKLLTSDKNFLRKYQEIAMAIAVERKYTKEEILEMYINSVYFGEGAFGINDAAKTYFNKSPQELNLAESTMLVGLLPAPAIYSPLTGDQIKAKKEQDRVLSDMVENGKITGAEKKAAEVQQLAYKPVQQVEQKHAQHFAEMVIDELKQKYGEETIIRSGFDVKTTLDLGWQKKAENDAREKVQALIAAKARNAGLVAIDPKTGEVRALVGSVDWDNPTFGKVNMALSARQPGSSFKPIYYTRAIETKVITAATILEDEPKDFGGGYKPTNYDFKYRGNIPVRNALSQSLNIPAVEVMEKLGVNEATQTAQRMGISTVNEPEKYGLSLALGTAEVKLYEMVNAYATFANGGRQYDQTTFTSIKNKYDENVFEAKQRSARQIVSPEASYIISSILSDNQARAPTFGSSLNIENRKVAVKTGTTNDSKDAWTIGFTPNLAVGVWMGNNENEPMIGLAGSASAGGVWKSTMTSYLQNLPQVDFARPANIVNFKVCNTTSFGNGEEVFIKGTEPKESCTKPKQEKKDEKKQPEEKREEKKKPRDNGGEGNGDGGRGGDVVQPTPEPEPEPTPEPQPDPQPSPDPPPSGGGQGPG